MHRTLLLPALFMLALQLPAHAQVRINLDDVKFDLSRYIFYGRPPITKCSEDGTALSGDEHYQTTAELYSTFTVHRKLADGNYVIRFEAYSTNKGVFEKQSHHEENLRKAMKFNFVAPAGTTNNFQSSDNKASLVKNLLSEAFFIVSEQGLKDFAYVYNPRSNYEFSYGTISYLARIRPRVDDTPGKWSTDFNLGLTAGIRGNYGKNVGVSLLFGISITKVVLDSFSTRGYVRTTSEKPSFTPSLNALISYRNFTIGFGAGMDWISENTENWLYNRRLFFAVGFGINIFSSSADSDTTVDDDQ